MRTKLRKTPFGIAAPFTYAFILAVGVFAFCLWIAFEKGTSLDTEFADRFNEASVSPKILALIFLSAKTNFFYSVSFFMLFCFLILALPGFQSAEVMFELKVEYIWWSFLAALFASVSGFAIKLTASFLSYDASTKEYIAGRHYKMALFDKEQE